MSSGTSREPVRIANACGPFRRSGASPAPGGCPMPRALAETHREFGQDYTVSKEPVLGHAPLPFGLMSLDSQGRADPAVTWRRPGWAGLGG